MPSKNKPNGFWTFKCHLRDLGLSEDVTNSRWAELDDETKAEWKEYAKNGGNIPRGACGEVRVPNGTMKKAKKSESKHKPDTSSSVDQESMMYNPHLSREVQAMIDEKKAVKDEKCMNVINFSAQLPGTLSIREARSKPVVYIHMYPLYDGDEKSYNQMQWHPSIIFATRFSVEKGVTHQYHTFMVADDIKTHVERAQMLNEGRCQVLHGAVRMACGPRLPLPCVSSIQSKMFPGFEADYCAVINNLANLIFMDSEGFVKKYTRFDNVIFAHPVKTQDPDLETNWMAHCLEQELMLRRLTMHAKAAVKSSCTLSRAELDQTERNIKRLESLRIQPLGYYWSTLHAVKMVEEVTKDIERRAAYIDMIQETRISIGRRQASLVVRPYMKCEFHATEDNKCCMPAEGRTILAILLADLLTKFKLRDTEYHNFTRSEEALREYVKKSDTTINNVFSFYDKQQVDVFKPESLDSATSAAAGDAGTSRADGPDGDHANGGGKRSSSELED